LASQTAPAESAPESAIAISRVPSDFRVRYPDAVSTRCDQPSVPKKIELTFS